LANENNARITAVQADLDDYKIQENSFDLILCFNVLDRRMFPDMLRGLKPGGFIFYETFTIDHLKHSSFKKEWVLEHNELLRAFSGLRVIRYRETDQDDKAIASLVAQK
jgi:SAM-dependent methyltransferase